MEKIDARSLSTDAQQQLRYQAIRLRESGRTYAEIALVIGVHRLTISGWWKAYQGQGLAGIEIKKRGRRLGQGRRRWSIALPIRTVGDYLKRFGLNALSRSAPQKPS